MEVLKMKRIKLSTHRNAQSNSKKLGAYAVEQELNKKFKQLETMDCPSCYGTMSLIDAYGSVTIALIVFHRLTCWTAQHSGFAMDAASF